MAKRFRPKLNPAFHRYPAESMVIGRVVVSFGEVEYTLGDLTGIVMQHREIALKVYYGLKMASSRIDTADTICRPWFLNHGLHAEYSETLIAVRHCSKIRNVYAHCNWADDSANPGFGGLFYTDLQSAVKLPFNHAIHWRHVDQNLLDEQEDYFIYTMGMLMFLKAEASRITGVPIGGSWPKAPKTRATEFA